MIWYHQTAVFQALFRLLRPALGPYRGPVTVVITMVVIQALGNLYLPNLNADIINGGVAKGDVGYIWRTGAVMLALALGLGLVSVVATYFASRTSMGVGRDLRARLFERVQRFSVREMTRFGTPSLITRNTNDVQQLQLFMQLALTLMVLAPITGVGGVIMALTENVTLSGLLAIIVPLMLVVVGSITFIAVPLFRSLQGKIDRITQVLREQITGVRVIRAFIRTGYEQERFEIANTDLTSTALRVNRLFALAMPSLLAIMNLSSVAVVWFGARLIDSGQMPVGNLVAFLSYIMQILFAVMMAVMMAIFLPRAAASASRIDEVLRTEPSIGEPVNPVRVLNSAGDVEFRGVTFGYPGGERPVLQDLSFDLRPGETTAIIGGTGSGKTTLINLIPRFFDVSAGELLVDGVDVRRQTQEDLWSGIGLIPQQAYLFQGTVADNLRFGRPDATDAELWHALEVAQGRDFVAAMPGQLQAPIDQGGTNVSGGQRQRLAIARALVKQPRIYLFDDAFSALDAGTDARLRAALKPATAQATVVIVAQRVSTILHADRIIVLDAGRIVGLGTHEELLAGCTPYQEIVASQLGQEVAA
jgi:ATP-binding cassette subfamily B protein